MIDKEIEKHNLKAKKTQPEGRANAQHRRPSRGRNAGSKIDKLPGPDIMGEQFDTRHSGTCGSEV